MKKAIFLDRDGTIIEDVGFIKSVEDVVFFENIYVALKMLQEDYLLFIVTNQSGVGKGFLKIEEVGNVNNAIIKRFKAKSINITEVYVCHHTKNDKCKCHKPSPYFLLEASKKYEIDLSNSYLIGDHPSDVFCAENAGAIGIYLLTGHGMKHLHQFENKPIIKADILEAAKHIKLRNCK